MEDQEAQFNKNKNKQCLINSKQIYLHPPVKSTGALKFRQGMSSPDVYMYKKYKISM